MPWRSMNSIPRVLALTIGGRWLSRRQNLTKLDIAAAIKKAQSKRAERFEVTADWVIDELRKIAGANMADYMKSTP